MLDEEPVPINDRIITMRLPPQRKVYATFYSVYALTMTNTEETKEEFHSETCMRCVPSNDRLIIVGDFNARVGSDL